MASTLSRLSESSATCLMCSGRLFGPMQPGLPSGLELEPELGGDHHPSAKGCKRFADEFFVGERTVDFSRIEEGDAAIDRRMDERRSFPCLSPTGLSPWLILMQPSPRAETSRLLFAKYALLHLLNSCS